MDLHISDGGEKHGVVLPEELHVSDPAALIRAVGTGRAPNGEELDEDTRRLAAALLAEGFRQQYGDDREVTPERIDAIIEMTEEMAVKEDAGWTNDDFVADAIKEFGKEDRFRMLMGLADDYQFIFDGESQHVVS
jgi:hypothetical protein